MEKNPADSHAFVIFNSNLFAQILCYCPIVQLGESDFFILQQIKCYLKLNETMSKIFYR